VATDQKTSTLGVEPEPAGSVIENELPTYRAISNLSIFSVVCGLLSIFSWAHPLFYLASVLAVALGLLAHRNIRHYPDMLTGHGLASAGVALGLIFGLGSATYTTVQFYVRSSLAQQFAKHYAETVQSGSFAEVLTLHMVPAARKDQSGEQLQKQIETASAKEKMMMDQKYGPLLKLRQRVEASKEEHIEFVKIEAVGEDDSHGAQIPIYALALFEVHGPGSKAFPEKEQYILAVLKGLLNGKQYEWWVDDIRFPYTPRTYEAPVKAPDDGHGHAH
jgi:Domain of unknown function (DUF4190)